MPEQEQPGQKTTIHHAEGLLYTGALSDNSEPFGTSVRDERSARKGKANDPILPQSDQ